MTASVCITCRLEDALGRVFRRSALEPDALDLAPREDASRALASAVSSVGEPGTCSGALRLTDRLGAERARRSTLPG